jgi:hypothetical protein
MVRALTLLLAFAVIAPAAIRLYMKDGQYHTVREYKVQGDRIRFYSTERGDWEEIPLELVDLKRTEGEIRKKDDARLEEAKQIDAEDAAERAQREEIERIPYEAGVFFAEGDKVTTLKQAESKIVSNRRRSVLKVLTPIPIVSGKATVELDGLTSAFTVPKNRPEFYVRLAAEERFAIVKLTPSKTSRIVQKWDIVPVTKEIVEQTEIIETFKQQLADNLYKIWPTKPLESGEYAVVEYTEGKGNIQIWDFSVAAEKR